jgi:predicted DNA-binding protein
MTHQINKTLFEIRERLVELCKFIENRKGRFTRQSAEAAVKELTDCYVSIQSLLDIPRGSEIHLIQELVSSTLFYRNLLLRTANVDEDIQEMEVEDGKKVNRAEFIEYKLKYMVEDMLEFEEDFKETYEHARMLLQRFGFDCQENTVND